MKFGCPWREQWLCSSLSLCQSKAICLSARGSVFTELSSSPAIIGLDVFHMLSHRLFLRLSGNKSLASPGHSGCQINHTSVPAPAKAMQGVSPRARRTTCRAQDRRRAKCYVPCLYPVWKTSNTSKLEQTWVIKRKPHQEATAHLQYIFPSNGSREHQEAQSVMSSRNSAGRIYFPLAPTSS